MRLVVIDPYPWLGLSQAWQQCVLWINTDISLNGSLGTYFGQILINIEPFLYKQILWKCRLQNHCLPYLASVSSTAFWSDTFIKTKLKMKPKLCRLNSLYFLIVRKCEEVPHYRGHFQIYFLIRKLLCFVIFAEADFMRPVNNTPKLVHIITYNQTGEKPLSERVMAYFSDTSLGLDGWIEVFTYWSASYCPDKHIQ